MCVSAEFSKFPGGGGWEGEEAKLTLRFDDVIICLIMSTLKNIHKQVAYRLLIGRGEIPGDFCLVR